jgi:hypothetical protein
LAELSLADSLNGDAKAAFDSANILIENQDFVGASTKLGQAYALSKDPRLLFNMAICEKNLHHYARMQTLLKQYEIDAGTRLTAGNREKVEDALRAINNLVGTVTIEAPEPGAAVAIDGASMGTTPLSGPVALDLGAHTLTVRKEGFEPFQKPLDVVGGSGLTVTATLLRIVQGAHLTVITDAAAVVRVDDGAPATNGRFDGPLPSGPHTVRVMESGKVPYAASVDLRNGENRTLDVTLESERRAALWPWIVGGAAVAVAAAAAGGYFLFKSSPSGGPSPPPAGTYGTGLVQFSSFGR